MAARGYSCIACSILRTPHVHDHKLFDDACPSPYKYERKAYRTFRTKISFPPGTCYQCGCQQHVRDSLVKPMIARSPVSQLKYTDASGAPTLLHDFNDANHCDWTNTFIIVAWLVRMDPALQRVTRPILISGLDFEPCPFEKWLVREDSAFPMSNLLVLYHFLESRL